MGVLEIMEAMDTFDPMVEFIIECEARVGMNAEYFFAFCSFGGKMLALNVEYTVPRESWYFIGNKQYYSNQVYLNAFRETSSGLERTERVALCPGADPRVVSNGETAYGIITTFKNPGWGMTLYDFGRHRLVPIEVDIPGFNHGKNWQPFLVGSELFIVHELTPFRILSVDVETGQARVVEEREGGFNILSFYEPYSMFRGGSNAIDDGVTLFGLGRTTSQRYRHQPFLWSVGRSTSLRLHFTSFFHTLNKYGFNIIDPTSIFFEGEDILLGLCCSERDWAHNQTVINLLLRFSCRSAPVERQSLSALLSRKLPTKHAGRPRLDRHMFFCAEMPGALASRTEHGGRVSSGVPGHLVYGPYIQIEHEGRYRAELSYLTKFCPAKRVGHFDVVVNRGGGADGDDFRTLGQIELSDSTGNVVEAHVDFDTIGLVGGTLEFRVFVEDGVELNAFHVRTRAQDPNQDRPGRIAQVLYGVGMSKRRFLK